MAWRRKPQALLQPRTRHAREMRTTRNTEYNENEGPRSLGIAQKKAKAKRE
jgi:hypothetical protein